MSGDIPLPLISFRGKRDYYQEFIDGSRWLRQEQAIARTAWFEEIGGAKKADVLFEFEMLLKGLVCFGNPVNHPGPPRRGEPAVARAFKDELSVLRATLTRVVETGRLLSGGEERSRVFQRYLESVIAQDETRFSMVKQSLTQDTPAESLTLLISALQNLQEIVDGLLSSPHVSFRLFSSIVQLAQREIHRSTYFDPLAALEFRIEFDTAHHKAIVPLLNCIHSDPARKVAALSFLSMFRLLKYLDAIDEVRLDGQNLGMLFGWLAVLRSDARALTIFFKRDTATWISNGFERIWENLEPTAINMRFPQLETEFSTLRSLRKLLASVGDQLRLEQRKVFEQQLPAISSIESLEQFSATLDNSVKSLRSFLQNIVVLLAQEFDPSLDGTSLFGNFISVESNSGRLRRDIWMFQQILRAFIEKTKDSAGTADQWTGLNSFRFIRQFVKYFRSMGYQLLRYSDYEQFDNFMSLVDRLREGDVLETQRFSHVVEACEDFQNFLKETFESVGLREELKDIPFDKKEAARTLMLFLKH
jgi:hypothetical protein